MEYCKLLGPNPDASTGLSAERGSSLDHVQVAAFKDYKPGGGGGGGGGQPSSGKDSEKGKPETSVPTDAGSEGGDEGGEEASGGGGDFPPHTVMGLPALSPTMQQGVLRFVLFTGTCLLRLGTAVPTLQHGIGAQGLS